jgi:hypothetical protein
MAGFNRTTQTNNTNANRKTIDFEALNKHVVEVAESEEAQTVNGVISQIIDMGNQVLEDARYNVDKGDEDLSIEELEEKYSELIEEGKITKFDLAWDSKANGGRGGDVIKKFVPQKPRQCIIFSVDFPDIMVDKAQFITGESDPKPLRLYSGGTFRSNEHGHWVCTQMYPLRETKDDKLGWTISQTNTLFKMAKANKLLDRNGALKIENIDKLAGQTFQFEIQVYFNDKGYYNERMRYVGAIKRNETPIDYDSEVIQFTEENDLQAIKELREVIKDTMTLATNFEGSVIQEQLKEAGYKTPSEREKLRAQEKKAEADQEETEEELDQEPEQEPEEVQEKPKTKPKTTTSTTKSKASKPKPKSEPEPEDDEPSNNDW